MNSLEALNKLCDMATPDGDCLNYVIGLATTIKQDLERLEHLEKENKEKDEIIADLEQMYKTASNNYSKLNDKRKKLEKVIDLLDTALDLELENSEEWGKMIYFINSNGGSTLKKENYDLLKEFISEVLNDE